MSWSKPPQLMRKLLHKMFPVSQMEEIEGDLLEDFAHNLERYGKLKARVFYYLDVIRLFKLYLLLSKRKQRKNTVMNKLIFFHLKYGIRSLCRQKLYQALNVITLTLGFSCFTLIFLFVYNQYQKDSFLENQDQIARLGYTSERGEATYIHAGMAPILMSGFPQIEAYSRVSKTSMEVSFPGSQDSFLEEALLTDPDFIDIFQIELLQGRKPISGQKEVMISQGMAMKLYGQHDVLGKSLPFTINGKPNDFSITGIMEDLPINSSYSNNIILPIKTDRKHPLNSNGWNNYTSYFKVAPNTDLNVLAAEIPEYLSTHTINEALLTYKYLFRPLDEIKSDLDLSDQLIDSVDGQVVFIFSIVGVIVLFLAIANYVNLLTALSLKRMQEMSIKKVMGASVRSLITQQVIESFIVCTLAILLSALIVGYLVQPLQSYLGAPLKLTPGVMSFVIAMMIVLPILLTLLASLYPAIIMSGIKFHELLKGKMSNSPSSRLVRSGLLVVQFVISSFLIVGTLTYVKQLDFIKSFHNTAEIGEVLILKGKLVEESKQIKQRFLSIPEVDKVSLSSLAPGPNDNGGLGMHTDEFITQFDIWLIDRDFLDVMGLELSKGDNFYDDDRNKFSHVLFNETQVLNSKENPFGKSYNLLGEQHKVIGIIEDFPIQSVKLAVEPGMFIQSEGLDGSSFFSNTLTKVAIRLKTADYKTAIAKIEETWSEIYPDQPFDMEFMDDRLDKIYTAEHKMGQLFNSFTGVAILISCLGIFGLLTYLVQVKLKELGIRKVLGASFFSQVKTLTANIWKILIIASLLAFPLSYYFLENWLESFTYRTDVSTGLFLGTFIIFSAIICISIFWQVIRVNKLNPTEVLRTE